MATTPADRVTMLARRLRVDIDTATYPASQYQRLKGIYELNPIIEPRTQDDETYDDEGWMREATTGGQWRIEASFKHSTGADGETLDPVQAFLRRQFLAAVVADVASGEFGVMIYDKGGRATGYEFEGRAYVKSWARANNAQGDTEGINITIQGQGPLSEIINPLGNMAPVITSLAPATGDAAGGNHVNIYGRHFMPAGVDAVVDIDFGANPATEWTVVSDSHIVATAPAGAAGTVHVSVTTSNGTSANTAADDYEYTA
ncbi:phage tail tube protein [Micromonospora echinospora]